LFNGEFGVSHLSKMQGFLACAVAPPTRENCARRAANLEKLEFDCRGDHVMMAGLKSI
jgi:hypothetical protein